jgi:diguanylate cyclase (GGDEF)-like protein
MADVLGSIRPLVIEVDGFGVVRVAYGGFGGFLGHDVPSLVGQSVFDHLAPSDATELAQYFIESIDESLDTVSLPLPFRVDLIGGDGHLHAVDVIAAGRDGGGESWSWVATLVPAALQASISRPLDALMASEPRARVKALLTEDLAVDNDGYQSRAFLVEPISGVGVDVITSRPADQEIAAEIARCVRLGWAPWEGVANAETVPLAVDSLPGDLPGIAAARGWRRVTATTIQLGGEPVAVYLVMGRVPTGYDVGHVTTNIASRYGYLARATALIMSAWRDRDRLEDAATHDALTGLANRRAFDAVLGESNDLGLLFIDVDGFKSVNDEFGHDIGDAVLVEIASRIEAACGEHDLAARIGGDEFAIVVHRDPRRVDDGDLDELGVAVAEAVGAPLGIDGGPHAVTVCVGAVRDAGDTDAMARASRALRAGKERLRSRPMVSPSGSFEGDRGGATPG